MVSFIFLIFFSSCCAQSFFTPTLIEAKLLQGFETDSNLNRNNCINYKTSVNYTGSRVIDDLAKNTDLRTAKIQLGLNTGIGPSYSVFNHSAAENFISRLSNDKNSQAFLYRSNVVLPNKILDTSENYALNTQGYALLRDGDLFRKVCGKNYISELHYQGDFYLALQLKLFDASDKDKLKLPSGLTADQLLEVLPHSLKTLNPLGVVSIQSLQIGGVNNLEPLQNQHCYFDDIKPCLNEFKYLLRYGRVDSGNNFIDQFPSTIQQAIPDTAAITDVLTQNYTTLNFPVIPVADQLTATIKSIRIQLHILYSNNLNTILRINYILGFKNLNQDYRKNVSNLYHDLLFNQQLLQKAADACFTELPDCVTQYSHALEHQTKLDTSILNEPKIAY